MSSVYFFLIYSFLLFFTTYNNFNNICNVNSKEKNELIIVSLFFGSSPTLPSAENWSDVEVVLTQSHIQQLDVGCIETC